MYTKKESFCKEAKFSAGNSGFDEISLFLSGE